MARGKTTRKGRMKYSDEMAITLAEFAKVHPMKVAIQKLKETFPELRDKRISESSGHSLLRRCKRMIERNNTEPNWREKMYKRIRELRTDGHHYQYINSVLMKEFPDRQLPTKSQMVKIGKQNSNGASLSTILNEAERQDKKNLIPAGNYEVVIRSGGKTKIVLFMTKSKVVKLLKQELGDI